MEEYGVTTEHGIQLHGIIVTHPDSDHLNGITNLLDKHRQKFCNDYDVVITEAFYWRSKQVVCTRFLKLMDRLYHKRDTSGAATCLTSGLKCYFPKESGCLLRCTARDDRVRRIQPSETFVKEAPKQVDANETSTLTVINQTERKCDAVLTGDSTATEILPLVEGKEIGIFQVPHHGSSSNSRLKDKSKLLEYSGQCNLSIVHNNEIKEILLFYSTFRAQCYLISAGGTESYKHPHPIVMQGIILANSLRHHECVIVLTNSRGLNSEKLKQLHRLAPQWTQYVKIYHIDDVFVTERQHTSLRPERCISDVRENTVEWTPKGYINWTKIMLPVKPLIINSRPLERNRFTEKATVEITVQEKLKFSAHIICIPLPHNPKSGDRTNCCYVIEESIVSGVDLSKALFLLDNDERIRSLSRAKNYVLFQYINNEWEKKQLSATLKDRSPQDSLCCIPYDSIDACWTTNDSSTQISPSTSPHQRINCRASSLQREQNVSPQTPSSRIPHRSTNSVQPVQNTSPPSRTQHRRIQPAQNVSPPDHIPHQRETSAQTIQNIPPLTPTSSIQHQCVQPVQTNSSQTPPSSIPHQSRNSFQPAQAAISPLTPPSQISHHSVQPEQTTSFQIPPSFIPHQSSCLQPGQAISPLTPPGHIPYQSVQQVQNISPQIPPSFTPHQGVNFLQPVQLFSPRSPPSHIPQQNVNPLQPALHFSLQVSPYSMQQLPQDTSSLQLGSEGATGATSDYVDLHVPQYRVQPTQHSTTRLLPAQDYSEYQSPTRGCRCQMTQCSNNRCGCRKQGSYCGPNCQCTDCKNNQLYAATVATSDHTDVNILQHRIQPTQHIITPSPAQDYSEYQSPTRGCRCTVTQCSNNRCGCKKQGQYCGPNCQCTDCKNKQLHAFHQAPSPPRVIAHQNIAVTMVSPSRGCGCKTGCATMRCGCKKQGQRCGSSCKCKSTYSNCVN